jgi:hypothetical protein
MIFAYLAIEIIKTVEYNSIRNKSRWYFMNSLRLLLESGKKVFGTLISLTDPCIGEVFGNIGYDCVWIGALYTTAEKKICKE